MLYCLITYTNVNEQWHTSPICSPDRVKSYIMSSFFSQRNTSFFFGEQITNEANRTFVFLLHLDEILLKTCLWDLGYDGTSMNVKRDHMFKKSCKGVTIWLPSDSQQINLFVGCIIFHFVHKSHSIQWLYLHFLPVRQCQYVILLQIWRSFLFDSQVVYEQTWQHQAVPEQTVWEKWSASNRSHQSKN